MVVVRGVSFFWSFISMKQYLLFCPSIILEVRDGPSVVLGLALLGLQTSASKYPDISISGDSELSPDIELSGYLEALVCRPRSANSIK